MKTIPNFRISAHAVSSIMAPMGLTEAQARNLEELLAKPKPTEKQQKTIQELIAKRDNPELPKGAKTYCENWLQSKVYERTKEIPNKYKMKGNMVEHESIAFIGQFLGIEDLAKNTDIFHTNFIKAIPDIVLPDVVVDAKSSWDWDTFPLYEKEIPDDKYEWQLQAYMGNTGIHNAKLIYVLCDTPDVLIRSEARSYCFQNGIELDPEIVEEFRSRLTYPDLPMDLRIASWDVAFDEARYKQIEERVKMCREYIKELIEWKHKGKVVMEE